jgi:hypothetical protein
VRTVAIQRCAMSSVYLLCIQESDYISGQGLIAGGGLSF